MTLSIRCRVRLSVLCTLNPKHYNFQRWMSWFPQRWRTQRNAIRNANCKTSWIIKILNAHCALGIFPWAYLSECLWTPLGAAVSWQRDTLVAGYFGFDGAIVSCLRWNFAAMHLHRSWEVSDRPLDGLDKSHLSLVVGFSLNLEFEKICCWLFSEHIWVVSWSGLQSLGYCLLSNSGSQIK